MKSSSVRRIFRLLSSALACGSITSCAFSQWTEHAYFGDYLNKPVYENRKATGFAIGESGKLDPLQLSPEQWEQLRRRVPPELVESSAALDLSCDASL